MSDANKSAFDTADNPPLGESSRTQKTDGPVFSKLMAEYHYDLHDIWETRETIEDYYGWKKRFLSSYTANHGCLVFRPPPNHLLYINSANH